MNTPAISHTQNSSSTVCPLESLIRLAQFSDDKVQSVSFYFSFSSFPDKSHREELLSIKHLVDNATNRLPLGQEISGLREDLTKISSMGDSIRSAPGVFRAVFACHEQHFWEEFRLPLGSNVNSLEIGRIFHIVPLLRANEECTPYMVALVEHGKSRVFSVRGDEIQEMKDQFPDEDLTVHADDSRVGWSRHIDANDEDRTQAYLKELAGLLLELMEKENHTNLVIGCRDDLWSEIEPQIAKIGMTSKIAGRFRLPGFEATPSQVLRAAKPVFTKRLEQSYADFWEKLRENPGQGVDGVQAVLESLESGRVQKLYIGETADSNAVECVSCGKWQLEDMGSCKACGSSDVVSISIAELMVHKALLTGVEILTPVAGSSSAPRATGVLLRY